MIISILINLNLYLKSKIAPWIKSNTLKIKNPLAKMHNEIIEFYQYVTPSD